jgi:UDP-glucose 4-epimerase
MLNKPCATHALYTDDWLKYGPGMTTSSPLLITGGAGYIGSHLAWAAADRGLTPIILDDMSNGDSRFLPPTAELIVGDVADTELVKQIVRTRSIRAAVHMAGVISVPESVAEPAKYWRINAAKALTFFDAARAAGVDQFVFSSTAAVYAPDAVMPVAETGKIAPLSPYGRSKFAAEQMLNDLCAATGARAGVFRYFNVAGADPSGRCGQTTQNATHLLKVACETALGRRPALPVYGTDYPTTDGSGVRDFIHVSDLAHAHLAALDHFAAGGDSFLANCGYGRGISVLEAAAAIGRAAGRKLPLDIQPRRPGDAGAVVADCSKITSLLDWTPRFADIDVIAASALNWERKLRAGLSAS